MPVHDEEKQIENELVPSNNPKEKDSFDEDVAKSFSSDELKEMENNAYNGAIDDYHEVQEEREATSKIESEYDKDFLKEDSEDEIKVQVPSNKKRRNIVIGTLLGSSIVLGGVGLFMLAPTVLVKHVMSNVKDKFMDRVQYATTTRAEKYVQNYFEKMVGPSIRKCGTYVTKNCTQVSPQDGIAKQLFTNWRDNGLEEKIANKYGLEFKLNTRDSNIVEVFKDGESIGDFGKRSVTREVTKLVDAETKFSGIIDRWHVRYILGEKYAANKWCIIACKKRDEITDIKLSAIQKLKIKIISRVVLPRNERVALYMICFVFDCKAPTEEALQKTTKEAAEKILQETDEELVQKIGAEIGDKSISQFVIEKAVQSIVSKLSVSISTEAATSAIPIAGQIYLAITIIDALDRLDEKIEDKSVSAFMQNVNEAQYAQYFAIWQAMDEDIQSGEASPEDVGAAVELLNGFDESRLWQKMSGSNSLGTVNCEDGKVLSTEDDALVCPEKMVRPDFILEEWRNSGNGKITADLINNYGDCLVVGGASILTELFDKCPQGSGRTRIRPILNGINYVGGAIGSLAFKLIENIPGVGNLVSKFSDYVSNNAFELLKWVATKVFPVAVNGDAEGGEAFDQIAGSTDVVANSFAKGDFTEDGEEMGLGAQALTVSQQVALDTEISNLKKYDLSKQSLYAKYIDPNNASSITGKTLDNIAMASPKFAANPLSIFAVPFKFLSSTMNTFIGKKAKAALPEDRSQLFGVTQYGIPVNDPVLDIDPSTLTDEVCVQYKQERESTSYIDPETKEKIYTRTDPCQLDRVITSSLYKAYSLDESQTSSSSRGSGLVNPEGYSFPLAPQKKIDYDCALNLPDGCHHDETPAVDLMDGKGGSPVYAIYKGTIVNVNPYPKSYPVTGCYSIQFRADPDPNAGNKSYYYWYGHLQNPIVTPNQTVEAGQQIAETAEQKLGSACWGGGPHLHIDRGCTTIDGIPQSAGEKDCRDPDFIPFLRALWEGLPSA